MGGGQNMNSNNDDYFLQKGCCGEYSKNAYILVYERKTKDPLQIVFENE